MPSFSYLEYFPADSEIYESSILCLERLQASAFTDGFVVDIYGNPGVKINSESVYQCVHDNDNPAVAQGTRLRVKPPRPRPFNGLDARPSRAACHPAFPHLAQGAAQVTKDVAVLGVMLGSLTWRGGGYGGYQGGVEGL